MAPLPQAPLAGKPPPRWYGEFDLAAEECLRWDVGPLRLWVQRRDEEWRIRHEQDEDLWRSDAEVQRGVPSEEADGADRFFIGDRSGRLHVQPMLPDRAIVSRPAGGVFVPAGESVRLYVSAPLWLQLEVGELRKLLREVPTMRPSDTWFGPSNMVGELCYAMRSRCRLRLDEADFLPYRATIPVQVRNHSAKVLVLERLRLPVRQLGLFATPEHAFWAEEVGFDRHDDAEGYAALRIGTGAPPEARDAVRVAASRDVPTRKTAIHAFSALFSGT
jgi:hypothetical protein